MNGQATCTGHFSKLEILVLIDKNGNKSIFILDIQTNTMEHLVNKLEVLWQNKTQIFCIHTHLIAE